MLAAASLDGGEELGRSTLLRREFVETRDNVLARQNPTAFEVYQGRLFFNLSHRVHQGWQRNKDEWISEADANWPDLKNAPGYGPTDAR